jgi:hypothetical protein
MVLIAGSLTRQPGVQDLVETLLQARSLFDRSVAGLDAPPAR